MSDLIIARGEVVSLTTSAGLATYLAKEEKGGFIKRADDAMYQSKLNGENQITISD